MSSKLAKMDRRRFLRITTIVTIPFVTGCIGSGGGEGNSGTPSEKKTTTEGETILDGKTVAETTSEPTQMTRETDTTASKSTETTSDVTIENPYRQPTPMGTPAKNGLAIVGIHPTEQQREFISGEYITLKNTGNDPIDLSGYILYYSGKKIYTYSITLEPGALLYTLTRTGEDTMLATSPPGYIRFADYEEPILDDNNGTVVVTNTNNKTILKYSYNNDISRTSETETKNETKNN